MGIFFLYWELRRCVSLRLINTSQKQGTGSMSPADKHLFSAEGKTIFSYSLYGDSLCRKVCLISLFLDLPQCFLIPIGLAISSRSSLILSCLPYPYIVGFPETAPRSSSSHILFFLTAESEDQELLSYVPRLYASI